jgi:hypothetical protein
LAVGHHAGDLVVGDEGVGLGGDAGDGGSLDLIAVGRVRAWAAVGAGAGTLIRRSIERIGWPGSGGRPRPSLKWQPEQERALKSGPRPSRDATDAGAATQFSLKNELPTKKAGRWRASRLRMGKEKASRPVSDTSIAALLPSPSACGLDPRDQPATLPPPPTASAPSPRSGER